jgi:hypothetical protein
MAAARWWRERLQQEEVRERHEAVARERSKSLLLPLEETPSDSPSADPALTASEAGPVPSGQSDSSGGVSSNGGQKDAA